MVCGLCWVMPTPRPRRTLLRRSNRSNGSWPYRRCPMTVHPAEAAEDLERESVSTAQIVLDDIFNCAARPWCGPSTRTNSTARYCFDHLIDSSPHPPVIHDIDDFRGLTAIFWGSQLDDRQPSPIATSRTTRAVGIRIHAGVQASATRERRRHIPGFFFLCAS